MADVTDIRCLWCRQPYEPRRDGGKRQRFCSKGCRVAFFDAVRAWALMMVEEGTVTVDEIRKALPATCTLPGRESEALAATSAASARAPARRAPAEFGEQDEDARFI